MIDYSNLSFRVEPMTVRDIPAIMAIEVTAFSAPWSERAYDYELRYNEMAHYFVVRPQSRTSAGNVTLPPQSLRERIFGGHGNGASDAPVTPIVGYGGFWLMVDEGHISTIATHPDWRRQGVGELLLVAMIESAAEVGAQEVTLEVRVSNIGAQALYKKYAFEIAGTRKHYYSDNGEDAYIMTTPRITRAEYRRKMQDLQAALVERLTR
jgi:[ribosomal protein S18]-alanine N-acetyltransferase